MRRREPLVSVTDAGGVPAEILLGPCVEVWADDDRPEWCERDKWPPIRVASAWRNWTAAKDAYLDSIGLPWPRLTGTIPAEIVNIPIHPWSFAWCAERYPEMVQDWLARAGLPPDWRPS